MKDTGKQRLLDLRYLRMAAIWAENSYCQRRKVGVPTLMACGWRSSITAAIWSATTSGVTLQIDRTPRVFCAVTAVMATDA